MQKEGQQSRVPNTFSPCSEQDGANQVTTPASEPATDVGENVQQEGRVTTKKTGHSYRQTIHRMHWILLLASHTLAEPDLSHWGGTPTLHPLPCLPILCVPLGEPRGCG